MADAYFDQEIVERLFGHQFEVPTKRGDTQVGNGRNLFQADFIFIVTQCLGANLIDTHGIYLV